MPSHGIDTFGTRRVKLSTSLCLSPTLRFRPARHIRSSGHPKGSSGGSSPAPPPPLPDGLTLTRDTGHLTGRITESVKLTFERTDSSGEVFRIQQVNLTLRDKVGASGPDRPQILDKRGSRDSHFMTGDRDNGHDILHGGDGNDSLDGGSGFDRLDGGTGFDTVVYRHSKAGVTIDLSRRDAAGYSTGAGGDAEGDRLRNIEHLTGSRHDDELTGDGEDDRLIGGGADVLGGGEGRDILTGGAGGGRFLTGGVNTGPADADRITDFTGSGHERDTLFVGVGADRIWYRREDADGDGDIDTVIYADPGSMPTRAGPVFTRSLRITRARWRPAISQIISATRPP